MSAANFFRANVLPCLGIVVPPMLWAINTQAGQVLPYVECSASLKYAALLSFVLALGSVLCGYLSWRALRQNRSDADFGVSSYPSSFVFISSMSVLMTAIFAFTILLQGASSLLLSGCER